MTLSSETVTLSIEKAQLQSIIDALRQEQYQVVAPTVREQAIVYDEIESIGQLPIGWQDRQQPGEYRLQKTDHDSYFSYVVGPHSWKQFLFPAKVTVSTATRSGGGWEFQTPTGPAPKFAFLGVRACELAAIAVQDRVFMEGPYVDPIYAARREQIFVVAVNCTSTASTCFCTSMGTGPRCESRFDLALTEVDDAFVVEVGSERGQALIDRLPVTPPVADASIRESAGRNRQRAVDQIERRMDTQDLRDRLLGSLNHPHWDEVATRCLSCGNCTMVCPTCFCSSVSDVTDLVGDDVQRVREWDSCFDPKFSYTAGGTIHGDTRSRYRQWLTHKLASWHDQFGSSGCVGCGRCITWCPVGIDLTEEVAQVTRQPTARRSLPVIQSVEGAACLVPEAKP